MSTTRTPEGGYAIAFAPEFFVDCSWANPIIGQGTANSVDRGRAGWSTPCPSRRGSTREGVKRLRLLFEAGARTARSRLGGQIPRTSS